MNPGSNPLQSAVHLSIKNLSIIRPQKRPHQNIVHFLLASVPVIPCDEITPSHDLPWILNHAVERFVIKRRFFALATVALKNKL